MTGSGQTCTNPYGTRTIRRLTGALPDLGPRTAQFVGIIPANWADGCIPKVMRGVLPSALCACLLTISQSRSPCHPKGRVGQQRSDRSAIRPEVRDFIADIAPYGVHRPLAATLPRTGSLRRCKPARMRPRSKPLLIQTSMTSSGYQRMTPWRR